MRDTLIATSSCQYPADFFRYREAYKSLGAIAELFSQPQSRDMHRVVMLAGDSIYADATAGFLDAADPHERFTQQYHKLRNNWAWRKMVPNDPLFSIDDHELIDDWVPLDPEHPDATLRAEREKTRENGKQAFIKEMHLDKFADEKTYYQESVNGTPVFVMDSRTERSARNALNFNCVSMIHEEQLSSLHHWIDKLAEDDRAKPESAIAPKIVMSGSMLLPRLRSTAAGWKTDVPHASCLRSDGWDGYPKTMHDVLWRMLEQGLRKVIFVSGDAHIHCICNVRVSSEAHGSIDLVSVHGSALNAPFPFANAMEEDFQSSDTFVLRSAEKTKPLDIKVDTHFPNVGDGFCTIRISNADERQSCKISFAGKRNNYVPVELPVPFGEV